MPQTGNPSGVIRINQKRYTDAFIEDPDKGPDIYITSRHDALEGDLVEVELNDISQWRLRYEVIVNKWSEWSDHIVPVLDAIESEQDQKGKKPETTTEPTFKLPSNLPPDLLKLKVEHVVHLPFSFRFIQKTGSVVNILRRNSPGVAGGFLRPYNEKFALFSPTDARVPRMLIDIRECPSDFSSCPDRYKKILFVARIYNWDSTRRYALGNLYKEMGDSNQIQSRIETVLLENMIDDRDFPADVYEELEHLNHLSKNWFAEHSKGRRNMMSECVFTIDPKTARDLDDAVSIKMIGEQVYEVGVHIADVSYFVKEMTVVDYHARLRTTSVYLVDRVIPMLPRILCEQMCSLNPGEPKLCFSVMWKLDKYGRIIDEWFGRTVIKSCVKLSYEQAQNIIDYGEDISWIEESNMPQLFNSDWIKVSRSVLMLNKIARNLRASRFEKGALRIDQVKLKYELDPNTGYPIGFTLESRQESNSLIEEFMLLANMSVAKRIYKHSDQTAFLRRHPPSPLHLLQNVKEFCDAKGCTIDISSSQTIQRSLNAIQDPTTAKVVSHLLLGAMKNAEYICTGLQPDDGLGFHHFALNVPFYTHFTSPIRRYADVIVHRQLSLALGYECFSHEDTYSLSMIAAECTKRKLSAKVVSDTSQKLYFNLFVLKAGFCELLACVTKIYDSSFDVILVDYDRIGRVHLSELKPYLIAHKFQSFAGVRSLELTWGIDKAEKKSKKKKKATGKRAQPDLESRSSLELRKNLSIKSDGRINECQSGQQVIKVFDLVRVIVTANEKDICQLNVNLKIPGQ